MSALTEEHNTPELLGPMNYTRTVASGAVVYAGALAAQDANGKAVPAVSSGAIVVLGRAENTASAGQDVKIRTGKFIFDNDTTSAVTVADIGKTAYVLDDHTVTLTGGTAAVAAGTVRDVYPSGVVIEVN